MKDRDIDFKMSLIFNPFYGQEFIFSCFFSIFKFWVQMYLYMANMNGLLKCQDMNCGWKTEMDKKDYNDNVVLCSILRKWPERNIR